MKAAGMPSVMEGKANNNAGDIISFLSQIMSYRWPVAMALATHIYLLTSLMWC